MVGRASVRNNSSLGCTRIEAAAQAGYAWERLERRPCEMRRVDDKILVAEDLFLGVSVTDAR